MKKCCFNCESYTEGGYCFYKVEHITDPKEFFCLEFVEAVEPQEPGICKQCETTALLDRGSLCLDCSTALIDRVALKLMNAFFVDATIAKQRAQEIMDIVYSL
ncbi:MAG: hypothetical protein WC420_04265 [Candidatus Paceibacterota bacterium]|jgi:hypothetical protein